MIYLGLDLGSKTLGVSISDSTNMIANVLTTLRFDNDDYDSLLEPLETIIKDNNVGRIILGYPKNMNNTVGERALIALEFKKKLEKAFDIEVVMEDERLTSVISNNILIEADMSRKKRKKKVDGMAAVIILQNYLDRKGD
jgi:putative Holliday junction resolvase